MDNVGEVIQWQGLEDHILGFAPYFPIRATSKKHCDSFKDLIAHLVIAKHGLRYKDGKTLAEDDGEFFLGLRCYHAINAGDHVALKLLLREETVRALRLNDISRTLNICLERVAEKKRPKHMFATLLQAGARRADLWHVQRQLEDLRRETEDLRRDEEDLRRAKEDRMRAKEDRRRAKEDSRRSRQDARSMRSHSTSHDFDEEGDDDMYMAVSEQAEGAPEDDREDQDGRQEAVPEQEEGCAEGGQDKSDDMMEREELQRAITESDKSYRDSERQRENADVAEALMRSKQETAFHSKLLKSLNIVQFRLTRCARCPEVSNTLRTSEKLIVQRERIEGSCNELQPEFAGGMWVFVPLTHEDFTLANLEPCDNAILMYPEDEEAVRQALADISKDRRPKLKKMSWPHDPQDVSSNEGHCSELEIIIEHTSFSIRVQPDVAESCAAHTI